MIVVPTTTSTQNAYRSYLVRFWQSTELGGWRASAQCVQSGQTQHFSDVESLLTFLQHEISTAKERPMNEA